MIDLAELLNANTRHGGMTYQSTEFAPGRRMTAHRINRLFGHRRFDGQTVLDVGCNAGAFCVTAARRGAASVVGIDVYPAAQAAFELCEKLVPDSNIMIVAETLKNETTAKRLQKITAHDQFDTIFFCSMFSILGVPSFLELGRNIIFENNNVKHVDSIIRQLSDLGFKCECDGFTHDFGKRAIIRARR